MDFNKIIRTIFILFILAFYGSGIIYGCFFWNLRGNIEYIPNYVEKNTMCRKPGNISSDKVVDNFTLALF